MANTDSCNFTVYKHQRMLQMAEVMKELKKLRRTTELIKKVNKLANPATKEPKFTFHVDGDVTVYGLSPFKLMTENFIRDHVWRPTTASRKLSAATERHLLLKTLSD